ncbi:ABC transporter ATP-binding protein [Cellulomonas chengniuliangii]|uniref:ABC transporter ATP-binding protein n=1 Tax=Cellulomonas chengniuliangii TaxID=2968084 RepID=A0ABY5KZ96_9CELL|nr:ABC transporter ATP-binding protein [Cellulomonas chengniuliangii]MCC2309406.1 ABC transporter ATP-binding protein [Cellulomonas chengniuliangii]MCC2316677.1 ABC transporter ATP-binding protein [Cellulomonas chengniuliangii]UUI75030.1 ABC transporter ATP-binding protein [Cellulomonas chengniuliangii]
MEPTPVIQVENLRKAYGSKVAVEDVSLTVARGEIVGILGPNGAGKTTTVECLAGLRAPDSGRVRVLGMDPQADKARVKEVLGMQLQESELPAKITVREAMDLYASFYADPADPAELLADLGLTDRAGAKFDQLSGGQKQRLSVALALVGNPQIAVLDELTTGLDPQARRDTWGLIERIRERGVTVLLVTHFMEEAERLCDRVVLIDSGRVIATGTPAEVAEAASGGQHLRFRASAPVPTEDLEALPTVTSAHGPDPAGEYDVRGAGTVVQDVLVALASRGVAADTVRVEGGTLDDAFVTLTTHDRAGDPPGASAPSATAPAATTTSATTPSEV